MMPGVFCAYMSADLRLASAETHQPSRLRRGAERRLRRTKHDIGATAPVYTQDGADRGICTEPRSAHSTTRRHSAMYSSSERFRRARLMLTSTHRRLLGSSEPPFDRGVMWSRLALPPNRSGTPDNTQQPFCRTHRARISVAETRCMP